MFKQFIETLYITTSIDILFSFPIRLCLLVLFCMAIFHEKIFINQTFLLTSQNISVNLFDVYELILFCFIESGPREVQTGF